MTTQATTDLELAALVPITIPIGVLQEIRDRAEALRRDLQSPTWVTVWAAGIAETVNKAIKAAIVENCEEIARGK